MSGKQTVLLLTLLGCVLVGIVAFFAIYQTPQQRQFAHALDKAKQGKASAQAQVAAAYLAGAVVEQNTREAVDWYLRAAAQGYAPAAYELAQLYLTGTQVPRDMAAAISYLKLAADKEHAPAQYELGRLYQVGTEGLEAHLGQAVWWWLHAAAQEHSAAQAALAQAEEKDPELVHNLQRLFIQKQHAEKDGAAAFDVAQAYQNGWLEKDQAQMIQWLEHSAAHNNAAAHYALFKLYTLPDGPMPQDENKALEHLQHAAEEGFPQAQYEVGERIYHMAQTPQEYQIAWQWFDLAAKQNHPQAIYMSGIMRMQGVAGEKNISIALTSFKHAAELGHADAQYVLGQSYWYGIGVARNKAQALEWLKLAAQNGNEKAAALLKEIK